MMLDDPFDVQCFGIVKEGSWVSGELMKQPEKFYLQKHFPCNKKKTNDWRDDDDAAPNSSLNCQDFIDFYLQHRDEFRKGDE